MNAGDVVLINFPFSDLSGAKLRPAVVVARVDREDFVTCQITSRRKADRHAIELRADSFSVGGLRTTSFVRPGKLFTSDRRVVVRRVGELRSAARDQIRDAVIRVIREG